MLKRSLLSLSIVWILLWLPDDSAGKRNWDYEPLSTLTESSNEDMIKLEAKVERVGRDEYAISADLFVNFDMDETTMVESYGYRSSSGNEEDYKLLPWSIPKQTFEKFVEEYYEKIIFKNLHQCSNIPETKDAYPWPKGTYTFDKCIVSGEGMPEIAPEGYYKVMFEVTGQYDLRFTAIVKVTTKTDMIG
ncbi:PREDICTED: uncharacterized protein LOC108616754 [Drosophila arizonae]|uniref:Uncharacterized protein LOC108616754 n=1 Tax=Drosophila arizonae TaxID=7263 RepID=A0ABM1PKC9_DROAR|nr:PREDICTED: uncharacterized protein LOC108616754 [Drosophila arizonae]